MAVVLVAVTAVRARLSAAGVLLIIATAGCTDHADKSRPSTTPSLTAPSSATSSQATGAAAVQEALAAYRNMWNAYVTASDNGTADPPELGKYTSDNVLEVLNRGLALNKSKGVTSKGKLQIDPKVTAFGPANAPNSVTVGDCVDDSHWLLYKADGQPADNVPGGRRKVVARVDKLDSTWKVTSFAAQGAGTC